MQPTTIEDEDTLVSPFDRAPCDAEGTIQTRHGRTIEVASTGAADTITVVGAGGTLVARLTIDAAGCRLQGDPSRSALDPIGSTGADGSASTIVGGAA